MTAALSPDLAIAYVRELSADVRAAVVLARNGAVLAGETDLAPRAVQVVAGMGDAPVAAHRTADGLVVAARTPDHALVVVCSPLALESTTTLDVIAAVAALDGAPAPDAIGGPEPKHTFHAAAEAAISVISAH